MRSKILALIAAGAMLFTFAPMVLAGNQYATGVCQTGDTSHVLAWENIIGDTSDGNDTLVICGNIADLSKINHTLPGGCKTTFPLTDTWNDCISSITTWTPSTQVICVYNAANYHDLNGVWGHGGDGVRKNIAADSTSSMKWIPSGDTCPN